MNTPAGRGKAITGLTLIGLGLPAFFVGLYLASVEGSAADACLIQGHAHCGSDLPGALLIGGVIFSAVGIAILKRLGTPGRR